MQVREMYQEIPGVKSSWSVSKVTLNLEQQQVDVFVEHPAGTTFCCPECSKTLSCYDHSSERQWRILDSCQFKTFRHTSISRVNCPEHGVKQIRVPWAEKCSRFTILFERFAIQGLLATQTVKGAMRILRTKWDQTWSIVERAVARGKVRKEARAMPRPRIDEKAFLDGGFSFCPFQAAMSPVPQFVCLKSSSGFEPCPESDHSFSVLAEPVRRIAFHTLLLRRSQPRPTIKPDGQMPHSL